jgi:DNA-binding NarL/FixJ family response regulator
VSHMTEAIDTTPDTTPAVDGSVVGPDPEPRGLPRVVIVDVRAERLRVTRSLLERSGLVDVVGETDSQTGALEVVARTSADLVLLEIQMPIDEGVATVGALRALFPDLRVVVCSFHQEAVARQRALEGGADAYLTKPIHLAALRALLGQFFPSGDVPLC